MTSPILLTGGTGTLGRRVLPLLRDGGADGGPDGGSTVRVLSRSAHTPEDGVEFVTGDLTTGDGIDAAVAGVRTVVHCAGSARGDEDKALKLVRAASRSGVEHVLNISVVGADRMPVTSRVDRVMFGYFASKLATERVIAESGVPWTTLRATQFYDLVFRVVRAMAKLPVIPVPAGAHFQPIDTGDVAARLAELARGRPSGLVPDIAGPRVYGFDELVRSYLAATDRHRLIVSTPIPGDGGRAVRAGVVLAVDHAVGKRTWEEFLADTLRPAH